MISSGNSIKFWWPYSPCKCGSILVFICSVLPTIALTQGRIDTSLAIIEAATDLYLATDLSRAPGLNSLEIYSLHQDRDGFIWMGCKSGVSRYDGTQFLNFTFSSEHPIGLIKSITEDESGYVWFGGVNGLFYNDGKTIRKVDITERSIEGLHFDAEGNLWVVGLGFIPFYFTPNERFGIIRGESPPTPKPIVSEGEWRAKVGTLRTFAADTDGNGRVWLALDNCHAYYQDDELVVTWQDSVNIYRFTAVSAYRADSVFWGSERTGLILEQDGLCELKASPTTYLMTTTDSAFYGLTATDILRLQDGEWRSVYDLDVHHSIYPHAFLLDREGNFWVGGSGCLLKISPSSFQNFDYPLFPVMQSNHGVGEGEMGELLIGSRGGKLIRYDGHSFVENRALPLPNNSLIQDIHRDKRGWNWYATSLNGLFVEREGTIKNFTVEDGLGDNTQYFFWEDPEGHLWTGGDNMFTEILIDGKGNVGFQNYPTQNYTLRNVAFNAAFSDPWGGVWATSDQGLYHLDNHKMTPWSLEYKGVVVTALLGVTQAPNGEVWMATAGDGLYQAVFSSPGILRVLRKWTTADGLTDNTIMDVLTDHEGAIWVLGRLGLCRLKSGRLDYCLGQLDNWPVNPSSKSQLYQTRRGSLWAVHLNGVQRIASAPRRGFLSVSPQTFIRSIETITPGKGISYFAIDTIATSNKWLTGRETVITFRFAGTNHYLPDQAFFRYRLSGFEEDWSEIDRSGVAVYRQLPPGEYRFEVRAFSATGMADVSPAILSFKMPPPWYGKWWFRLILILTLGGVTLVVFSFLASRRAARQEAIQLRQLGRFKSHFYTNFTHEFRTPITVILGMAEAAERGEVLPPMVSRTLGIIQRNGHRLLGLINGMLDLAKLESGHLEVQLVRQDVVSLIQYHCDSYGALALTKGIEFSLKSEFTSLEMDLDQEKISIILSNLLMNAINYTPSGGRVAVSLKTVNLKGEERLEVVVSDTGEGLSEAEKAQVFKRFFRTEKAQNIGTGIGLTVCREFVAVLGGEIGVESEVGTGSQFWFMLPITREAPPATDHGLLHSGKISDLSGRKPLVIDGELLPEEQQGVLIIEDDPDVASYLHSCFAEEYNCTHAQNGALGLEVAFEMIPDIIISDVMMPVLNGYEVCERLKTDPRTDHIPIVLLTARVELEDKVTGIRRGADAYLTKPFSRLELLARVEQLLSMRRRLQQKYAVDLAGDSLRDSPPQPNTFLRRAEQCVLQHLNDESFGGPELASALHLSKAQTYRKLKALTGLSTALFIRNLRLEKARQLLRNRSLSVSEIAYAVGYRTSAYFSQVFRDSYGESPTEYRKKMDA